MYKSILVVVSPDSKATPALHRGIELAHRSGARLHLVQFLHQPMIDVARQRIDAELADLAEREFLRAPRQWLYEKGAALSAHGIITDCEVVWAPVAHEAMLGAILELAPDLVIKDADFDHGEPSQADRSSTDGRLVRLCPAPLMLVRSEARLVPHKILAAVDVIAPERDAAAFNRTILSAASHLCELCEAELDVASAYSTMPVAVEDFGASMAAAIEAIDQAHGKAFDGFCNEQDIPVARRHRLLGAPSESVERCARELGNDLVVIGAAYRSVWDRLLMGSTAEGLVRHLDCDVLLIKPEGFVAELGRHLNLSALRSRYRQIQEAVPA